MAKKGNRQAIGFECSECKMRNYVSSKNVVLHKEKMTVNKFCNSCRKYTPHNESKLK